MSDELCVSVLELPAAWNAADERLARVDATLAEVAGREDVDLVLLPEMSLDGYVSPRGDFDLTRFAEPLDGRTVRGLGTVARKYGVHLVGPLVLAERDEVYNAMVVLGPDGMLVAVYRKRHPWFPERWATPGPTPPPSFVVRGVRVTIAICFDVHFLADDAASTLRDADLLLFPSAWVDEEDTRRPLLANLAATFDIAVANANWAPGVVDLPGQGGSCILDERGRLLAEIPVDGGGGASVAVSRPDTNIAVFPSIEARIRGRR